MIPVEEARARIHGGFTPVTTESIALTSGHGRVLSADILARRTQPPSDMSAMDGWAVRATDLATLPGNLTPIGESAAGRSFKGKLGPGQTVRIFTGAPVPEGADCIVLQEDADLTDGRLAVRYPPKAGQHIRRRGIDFAEGQRGIAAPKRLSARDLALIAAMDVPWVEVRRKPRIAVLATGDELVRPGEPMGPDQIVSSNSIGIGAFFTSLGADVIDLGIAPDRIDDLKRIAAGAKGADLLITLGGASVGDHDLIHKVLGAGGANIDFWRIAMRPGKPLMFGRAMLADGSSVPLLGLPGNPVSAMVTALLFGEPAMLGLLGLPLAPIATETALLGSDLKENDKRADFLRAVSSRDKSGALVATPVNLQDSSLLTRLALADCLVLRPPMAPAAKAGDRVPVMIFGPNSF